LILHHASPNGKIEHFGILQHFGSKAAALDRTSDHWNTNCWIYKVRIEKGPKDKIVTIADHGREHRPWIIAGMLRDLEILDEEDVCAVYKPKTYRASKLCLLRMLQREKIDLLRYRNTVEGGISWIVPDPKRVHILEKNPL
jgi:hypothetical protein